MRKEARANCEKAFVIRALQEEKRIDGRQVLERRKLNISFGIKYGACHISLGETRVFAQVSCDVVKPRQTRPNEGDLFINVEFSPMAAPYFEPGRPGEFGTEINRLIERCLKESKSVDVESLCIIQGEKAFRIRCDIHVLNHDGNLVDACCLAGHAALCHFRRPDFTLTGRDVTIHAADERDPVPLSIFHNPLCVTYAFFNNGKQVVLDPTVLEQDSCEGQLIVGINTYKEVCTLHLAGRMSITKQKLLRLTEMAWSFACEMVAAMKKALKEDAELRSSGKSVPGLLSIIRSPDTRVDPVNELNFEHLKLSTDKIMKSSIDVVESVEAAAASVVMRDSDAEEEEESGSEEDEESENSEIEVLTKVTAEQKRKLAEVELSGDSEEEETVVLESDMGSGRSSQWFDKW